jgi:hypothetical protein
VLTPWTCPTGWRSDAERGCIPTLRTDCPTGTGPLPDGTCTNTGLSTCPESTYARAPEGADPSLVVHVDDDAVEGGDGSRERPFRDLSPVLEGARAGTTVLLAAGRYPVQAEVRREITIRGVCAPRVELVTPDPPPAESLLFAVGSKARLTLEGVSSRTDHLQLVGVEDGARVQLRSVIGRADRRSLVGVVRATAHIEDVLFSSGPPQQGLFWAIVYASGGEAEVRRSSAIGSGARIARILDGASATIADVAAVGAEGGISAESRARLDVSRLFVSGGAGHGLWLGESGGTLRDIALEGVNARFSYATTASVERLSMLRGGIEVYRPATAVTLTDLAMVEGSRMPDAIESCLAADRGALATLRRARFTRCHGTALYATTAASIDLEDGLFRDVRPTEEGLLGVALTQALGGRSSLRRVLIDRAGMAGVAALHLSPSLARNLPWEMWLEPTVARRMREPSRIALQDVVIRHGESHPMMPSAGIFAGSYSVIEGERVVVSGQDGVGILAGDAGFERQALVENVNAGAGNIVGFLPPLIDGPSTVQLRDLYVGSINRSRILYDNTTRRSQPDFFAAYGAYVSPGCTMSLTNAFFEGHGSTEHALVAQGDLSVQNGVVTGASRCAALRSSIAAGTVTLDGVRVQGNGQDEVCVDDAIPALRIPMSPN